MSFLVSFLTFREPVSAWTHGSWLLLSIPATILLWRRGHGDPARRLSLLVFGVSLAICYAGSTLFHAVRLAPSWIVWFDELDHIGIFILIAGSYTPVAWNLLHGPLKWGTLVTAWLAAMVGTAMLLACGLFSIFWSTVFYLLMGWGAVVCYIELTRAHSHRTLFPLLLGGVLYSLGAVLNLAHWPALWPGTFGTHELFHLFVMAGSAAHFVFMLEVVASADRRIGASCPLAPPSVRSVCNSMTARRIARGLDQIPDPRIPKYFPAPLYLHASPRWNRRDAG
jgi:hemolysin III